MSVDLPAPLGPTSATLRPRSMVRRQAVVDRQVAVALAGALEAQHLAAAALAGGEAKVDRRRAAVGRRQTRSSFSRILDAALHQRGLRRLVAEAADERLDARDLLLLGRVGGGLLRALRSSRAVEIAAVRRGVVGERAARHLGDAGHGDVEEVAVVGDQDDRVRVLDQKRLEPVARLEVEVVGRLVEQQHVAAGAAAAWPARGASASRRRTRRRRARSRRC